MSLILQKDLLEQVQKVNDALNECQKLKAFYEELIDAAQQAKDFYESMGNETIVAEQNSASDDDDISFIFGESHDITEL